MIDQFSSSAENKTCTKKVKKISIASKEKLINSVINEHLSVHQASKIHKINYSSAKYIVNIYKKQGTVVQLHQKSCRKSKFYFVSNAVLVDQNSGEILLYKQTLFKKQSIKDSLIINAGKGLRLASKAIQKPMALLYWNYKEKIQTGEVNEKTSHQNFQELTAILTEQHLRMIH